MTILFLLSFYNVRKKPKPLFDILIWTDTLTLLTGIKQSVKTLFVVY